MSCIETNLLSKSYDSTISVDRIDLSVYSGKIFGCLLPNGAGKTTTIKLLTTLIAPTSGSIDILGIDALRHPLDVRKRIGVVLQQPSYEPTLSVEKSLEKYGMMWNVERKTRKDRVEELLSSFALEDIRNVKNDDLSIGQRRRVQVAREFMHDMELLFLDEPTVGLDPSVRRTLLDFIKHKVKDGLTVFFTTHILNEAEYLCDEMAIINKGKIMAIDTPAGLKQKYGGVKAVEIKLRGTKAQSVMEIVKPLAGDSAIEIPAEDTIRVSSAEAQDMLVRMIQALAKHSVQIESVSVNSPTLEEVFLTV